ncbi:hypothetical protein BDV95DRAFT_611240 [Massariosphaeria phaeospora]|uniref:RING-type domain-containing protein n=1 Tax=Massariosphaeria phaeospora TaxID=100035 RepID=A0A7C8I378_9PLEO|nr:hypothetical protein BDV95DRAFT_611240 [Massariosphaeria phaeospora]
MERYTTRTAFWANGLTPFDPVEPRDCDICREPLEGLGDSNSGGKDSHEGGNEDEDDDERGGVELDGDGDRQDGGDEQNGNREQDRGEEEDGHASHDVDVSPYGGLPSHCALRIKSCGHVFGASCLSTWIRTADTCPMCRSVLFEGAWWAELPGGQLGLNIPQWSLTRDETVMLIEDFQRIIAQLQAVGSEQAGAGGTSGAH